MNEDAADGRPGTHEERRERAAVAVLSLLVPAQFDIKQKIVEAIESVLEDVLEGLVGFVQNVMNAGIETFMFFPPPSGDPALEALWRKSLGVFFGLLLLGWLLYLLVMQLFPNTRRTDPYRMAERTLAGVVMVIVSRQVIVFAVQLTNAVGRYMYPEDMLTATLGGNILDVGGSIAAIVVAYVLSAGLVVSILSFVFVLGVRMVLVYMVYALFPLITALWIFDVGPGKYTKSLADTTFRTTAYLLVAGVLIAAILAAGGAVANAVDGTDTETADENTSALAEPANVDALSGVGPAAEPSGSSTAGGISSVGGSDTHLGPPPDGSTQESSLAAHEGEQQAAVVRANGSSGESSASSTFGAGTIAKVFALAVTFGLASVALGYLGFSASLSGLSGLVSGGRSGSSGGSGGDGGGSGRGQAADVGSSSGGRPRTSDGGRPPTNPSAAAAAGVGSTSDRGETPGEQTTLDAYDAGGMTNPPAAGASRGDDRSIYEKAKTAVSDAEPDGSKEVLAASVGAVGGGVVGGLTGGLAGAAGGAIAGKRIMSEGVKYGSAAYDIHDSFKQQGGYGDMKQAASSTYEAGKQRLGELAAKRRELTDVSLLDGGEDADNTVSSDELDASDEEALEKLTE